MAVDGENILLSDLEQDCEEETGFVIGKRDRDSRVRAWSDEEEDSASDNDHSKTLLPKSRELVSGRWPRKQGGFGIGAILPKSIIPSSLEYRRVRLVEDELEDSPYSETEIDHENNAVIQEQANLPSNFPRTRTYHHFGAGFRYPDKRVKDFSTFTVCLCTISLLLATYLASMFYLMDKDIEGKSKPPAFMEGLDIFIDQESIVFDVQLSAFSGWGVSSTYVQPFAYLLSLYAIRTWHGRPAIDISPEPCRAQERGTTEQHPFTASGASPLYSFWKLPRPEKRSHERGDKNCDHYTFRSRLEGKQWTNVDTAEFWLVVCQTNIDHTYGHYVHVRPASRIENSTGVSFDATFDDSCDTRLPPEVANFKMWFKPVVFSVICAILVMATAILIDLVVLAILRGCVLRHLARRAPPSTKLWMRGWPIITFGVWLFSSATAIMMLVFVLQYWLHWGLW